jgi:hypothetical protein
MLKSFPSTTYILSNAQTIYVQKRAVPPDGAVCPKSKRVHFKNLNNILKLNIQTHDEMLIPSIKKLISILRATF